MEVLENVGDGVIDQIEVNVGYLPDQPTKTQS